MIFISEYKEVQIILVSNLMELTLDQALKKGVEAHKAGKLQEADRYYTAILKAQPNHSHANHNMGILAIRAGKVKENG